MDKNKATGNGLATTGLFFAILGMLLSAILICKHVFPGMCSSSLGCEINGVDGCAQLGADPRSKLFGLIPLAIPGFFYYGYVASLFYRLRDSSLTDAQRLGGAQLLIGVIAFGVVMDIILAYTNFFVLPAPCLLCAYTYLTTLGIAIAGFFLYHRMGKEGANESGMSPAKEALIASLPGAGVSFALTGLILGIFLMVSTAVGGGQASSGGSKFDGGVALLPAEKAPSMKEDLESLKEAPFPTEGPVNVEGAESAFIEIHKFADFLCPHCYHASELLKEAQKRWPGRIRVYYRHFPLDSTCNPLVGQPKPGGVSCNGALAAICSSELGLFPEMYHRIFELQRERKYPTPDSLQALTMSLGGDWSKMVRCMGSEKTMAILQRDIKDAASIQLNSTPTLVVNGHLLPAGTPDRVFFLHLMDALVYSSEGQAAYEEFANRK